MVTAYILIKAHSGEADRIKEAITDLDGVVNANIVAGDVDFIAKIEVETASEVKSIAAEGIHTIDGVDTTQTYIGME